MLSFIHVGRQVRNALNRPGDTIREGRHAHPPLVLGTASRLALRVADTREVKRQCRRQQARLR